MPSAPTARSLRPPKADERQWEPGCSGKDPFASESSAEATLEFYRRFGGRFGAFRKTCWLNSYECTVCGSWHIGNAKRIR